MTGASGGVGRATARAFAARGDTVVLLARGREGLEATADDVAHQRRRPAGRGRPRRAGEPVDPGGRSRRTRLRRARTLRRRGGGPQSAAVVLPRPGLGGRRAHRGGGSPGGPQAGRVDPPLNAPCGGGAHGAVPAVPGVSWTAGAAAAPSCGRSRRSRACPGRSG
ncbi:hypothetical protein Q5694_18345 [Streptomyces sp. AHA2]